MRQAECGELMRLPSTRGAAKYRSNQNAVNKEDSVPNLMYSYFPCLLKAEETK
uniref:Uncharacterized protein n=1 Tax=Arundo donax TaxID=35708 RepID=A0A0A9AIW1_ARUDO